MRFPPTSSLGRTFAQLTYLRAPWVRAHIRQLSPSFWRRLQRRRRTSFVWHRTRFNTRWRLRELWTNASLTGALVRLATGGISFAGGLIVTLAALEYWINRLWPPSWPRLPLAIRDPGAFTDQVAAIVGLSGTLLGLYFAALSLVVSSTYKDVPADLREAMIRDRTGALYIRLIALACAGGLLILGATVLGWPVGVTNHVMLVIAAAGGVFGFVGLGIRSFAFFDPTQLTQPLEHRIVDAVRSATPEGFRWQDPSFQQAYLRNAESALRSYQNIASAAAETVQVDRRRLVDLAGRALALLQIYAEDKPLIPLESAWFRRKTRHRSWLTADLSSIEMAMKMDQVLPFDEAPDHFWFEEELERVLITVVNGLLARGELEHAYQVGTLALQTIASLTERLQIEEAARLHRELLTLARVEARRPARNDELPQARLRRLAAIDDFSGGIRSMVVSLGIAAERITPGQVTELARVAATERPGAPIGRPVPEPTRAALSDLRRRISFEIAVEGKRVTPDWYLAEVVARSYARYLKATLENLLEELEDWYGPEARALLAEGQTDFAVHTIQTGLGLCGLFVHHAESVRAAVERLASIQRALLDEAWPVVEIEGTYGRLTRIREQLLETLADSVSRLPKGVPTGDLPDTTGYAFTVLAQESYNALATGNHAIFRKLYPALLELWLTMDQRLRIELADHSVETRLVLEGDLIMDLLELSGFAMVFDQLDGGEVWAVVEAAWGKLLAGSADPAYTLNFILRLYDYRKHASMLSTRDVLRTSWKLDFQRRMEARGFVGGAFGDGPRTAEPVHPIAAVIVRNGMVGPDPADACVAEYLLNLPQAASLEAPDAATRFRQSLLHEQRRRRNAAGSDQDRRLDWWEEE